MRTTRDTDVAAPKAVDDGPGPELRARRFTHSARTPPRPRDIDTATPRRRRFVDATRALAIGWGASMVLLTCRAGSWEWIAVRAACVTTISVALARGSRQWPLAAAAGLAAIVAGSGVGVPHLLARGELLAVLGGLVALVTGLAVVTTSVHDALRGRRQIAQICGSLAAAMIVAVTVLTFVPSVMATNVPRPRLGSETPATFGLNYEPVEFTTEDGVRIAAWYVPSRNRAAVVVRHGAGSTRTDVLEQAAIVARHGYGVLLTDARGHGESGGRAMDFGWFGDSDIGAAVTFLTDRHDVDPSRIGVLGMSMGGEEAIGAAADDTRIRAVVAEGVTARTDADTTWLSDVYGARGSVQEAIEWLRFSLTDVLTSADKPIALANAVGDATATAFLVIAGGAVADEQHVLDVLEAADPVRVSGWTVPASGHTQGLEVAPADWERNVIDFFDARLLDG